MMMRHVSMMYRYTAMFARQGISRAKIARHFLQCLFSSDAITRNTIPFFLRHPSDKIFFLLRLIHAPVSIPYDYWKFSILNNDHHFSPASRSSPIQ